MVTLGKSEDVHTDQNLVDIAVGDPEVADVNPLTDHALSILGKKIGTTRVTVYGEARSRSAFSTSRCPTTFRGWPRRSRASPAADQGVFGQRPHHAQRHPPDAVTLDKAVMIARQFGPDPINTVQVMQPQQIMLEVRFIEVNRRRPRARRAVEHVRQPTVANIGNQ